MEASMWSSNGRIRRTTYWTRWIVGSLIQGLGYGIALSIANTNDTIGIIVLFLTLIPTAIFILIQGIKRMHDVDKSGWYLLIPIYNLILCFTEGTKGRNKYGDDPKK